MSDEWVVAMPKLGETVTEGEITNWFKAAGDEVAFDDPLFEVSTDKVDSEIPSPYDGVVVEILVDSGATVPVGTPLVRIGPPGSTPAPQGRHAGVDAPAAATPATAAAGGGSLSDPANPRTGGSEAMPALEDPAGSAAAGEVHDITMPKLGETVTEGTIGGWLKQAGDTVAFDDPLFEVSTDKVDSEIPSPYDGVLLEILVPAGETVPVGTPLARIGAAAAAGGGSPSGGDSAVSGSGPAAVGAPTEPGGAPSGGTPAAGTNGSGPPASEGRMLSPLVRRLVDEAGLDVSTITGTGAGGRIRREDVERAVASGGGRAAPAPAAPVPTAPAPAAPAPTAPAPTAPAAAPAAVAAPSGPADPRDEVVPLSKMRLAVAAGMKASQTIAASVWTSVEVDFENVEQVRRTHKDRFKKETGSSLSYLPFISRAVVDALRAYPTVNSSIDIEARTMTLHPYVNLGIAVDLDQQGLVVPVLKGADGLNMRGIAQGITAMAAAARNKKLGMADMQGSTFTITNPGPFASWVSAPIINQPNTGILCTDGVKRRPVAVGDMIAIHPTGIIGLVYDHRAFDGSTASLFLMHIRDSLEQRDWAAEVG
ncbi:2-oxoglutarate dehydrogenase, E2 component, dihydrolipoamide succinyltransferase [Pseudonocardia broussonetiae]|uniref:Dihydrolipoamide acetyltransferase component of pyruvate dehydrogenase complex n=1 Tax=Pseudonocardia broussonetiae TaxID=2736640 RepID=A0A6M6JLC2_9PSEU|nr:2-oxoglutarate dehydrogenase, E2 component, dihydrolipoamide succinyltransferase [Pseudonocardia broussonetiae]QJY48934.1 2-oxoglutarate dehydrogenase, E2 component, dihydrolipoamide succinyltransferase [Pseudonocardia broussonetiae]